MVANDGPHRSFSFSVRMNLAAQPLPSGYLTKAGELRIPRKAISLWKSSDVCAAVIMANSQPFCQTHCEDAEVFPQPLPDRLRGFKAIARLGCMNPQAFTGAVI